MEGQELSERWIEIFSTVSGTEGAKRAELIVDILNKAIAGQRSALQIPKEWPDDWKNALKDTPAQPASLPLAWQSFYLAQTRMQGNTLFDSAVSFNSLDRILVTTPFDGEFANESRGLIYSSDATSLLQYMGNLISGAQRYLYVMAPYWSEKGVRHLQRTVGPISLPDLSVTIMTPAEMSEGDNHGCQLFKQWLQKAGARVQHLKPRQISNGTRPFVHAKIMLSGAGYCYLGSANFSDNGLHRSIEIGTGLQGSAVEKLHRWLQSLSEQFELFN